MQSWHQEKANVFFFKVNFDFKANRLSHLAVSDGGGCFLRIRICGAISITTPFLSKSPPDDHTLLDLD